MDVNTVVDAPVVHENRFGVSLEHAQKFITAFRSIKIQDRKVTHNYPMTATSASVQAENFMWSILEYKVTEPNVHFQQKSNRSIF